MHNVAQVHTVVPISAIRIARRERGDNFGVDIYVRIMISYNDVEPGNSAEFDYDGPAKLHRLDATHWRVLRHDTDGAWATIANIARTDYDEAAWHVTPPFPAGADEEDWSNWGGALRSALSQPDPTYSED